MRSTVSASLLILCCSATALAQTPAVHELKATPATVHRNFFDASLKPVLKINSGDVVRIETSTGNPHYFEKLGVPKDKIPRELYAEYEGVNNDDRGDHTLTGPIYVEGAEPGDMLEVRIRSVELRLPIGAQSFVPNRGLLPEDFPYEKDRVLFMDLNKKTIDYGNGIIVPARPFWGVMGVAPPASMGRVSSGAPNVFGGNMDNRDLGAGATVYFPVHASGALLSIGDGHAVQGEGEVCLSAVETSLKGEIQVIVHKNTPIKWPRAETPTHYITMGLNPDLNEAAKTATREMLDFVTATKGLKRDDAYILLSGAMDLIVTQVVDGTKGIHAMLPKSIFPK